MNGSLAYIDNEKCRVCRKCEKVCPQKAIVAVNFPAPKPKPENQNNSNEDKNI